MAESTVDDFIIVDTYRARKQVIPEAQASKLLETLLRLEGTKKAVVVGTMHDTQRAAHQYGQSVARQLQSKAKGPLRIQPVETDGKWVATVRYRTVKSTPSQ